MNDIVKSAAGGFAKRLIKGALYAYGVPAIAGDVLVDVVAGVVSKAGNSNDAAAKAEFEQIKEDMLLELYAQKDTYNDKRPPSAEDVHEGLVRFAETYRHARNHKKRWVLFNAFYNSFQPGFYDEAVSQILWDKVERLEYPDFMYLHRLVAALYQEKQDPLLPSQLGGSPVHAMGNEKKTRIQCQEPEAEFATRLARENLLELIDAGPGMFWVYPKGLAREMRTFALKEAWRAESAEAALNSDSK